MSTAACAHDCNAGQGLLPAVMTVHQLVHVMSVHQLVLCRYGRSAPLPAMMASWRERLLTCLHLPLHVHARKEPNIMVVNRPHHQARGYLNADAIVSAMKVCWHCSPILGLAGEHLQHVGFRACICTCQDAGLLASVTPVLHARLWNAGIKAASRQPFGVHMARVAKAMACTCRRAMA